jgi:hypothetical protein
MRFLNCIQYDSLYHLIRYNVVFGGQEIVNGDESMDYYPYQKAVDKYGPSKGGAEKIVLSANGQKLLNSDKHLRTCSLRPAAIYGENETRHFSRIVSHIDRCVGVLL